MKRSDDLYPLSWSAPTDCKSPRRWKVFFVIEHNPTFCTTQQYRQWGGLCFAQQIAAGCFHDSIAVSIHHDDCDHWACLELEFCVDWWNLPERFHREGGHTASLQFRQQSSTAQCAIDDQVPLCPAISPTVRSGFLEIALIRPKMDPTDISRFVFFGVVQISKRRSNSK